MSETVSETLPGRRASFGFIFATAVMNALSFGLMIPVLPNLIKDFTGGDTAMAANWQVVFSVSWGVMQFVFGPILGMMSDRFGRRPVLLISLFGLGVDFLFMAFAPSLWWLLVGRVLNGITAASFSTANAYVADVTTPDRRARDFGWMSSAFSIGFLAGPVVGGYLADFNLRLPFIVAAAMTFANLFYGWFIVPESLAPERRMRRFQWSRANPVGALSLLRSHHELLGLASINFLYQLAHVVLPTVFVLYAGFRYHWTSGQVGAAMMLTGALGIVVQSFLVQPIVNRVGERGAVLIGCLSGAAGFAFYGYAPTGWAYLAAAPIFAFMNLLQPGLQGLMTRRVGVNEQGQLQGANQSMAGIASMAGPAIFGLVFAWSVSRDATLHMPGLAIWVASALMLAAFMVALGAAKPVQTTVPAE